MTKTYPVSLSKEEIEAIIKATMEDDFYYTLFFLAKKTGRRLGEYYDLKVKDIDYSKNILVTKILKRKKKIDAEAVIDDETCRILKQFISIEKLSLEDYVFHKYSYRDIQRKIKFYSNKAGITKNVSFHNFRHYFVTELLKQGWSYDKVAKLTGHGTISSLSSYDHVVASDIKSQAIEAIKNF